MNRLIATALVLWAVAAVATVWSTRDTASDGWPALVCFCILAGLVCCAAVLGGVDPGAPHP